MPRIKGREERVEEAERRRAAGGLAQSTDPNLAHEPRLGLLDAISCWDFMTVFGDEMELNSMPLDHFTELLQYTGRDSPALVEVFTTPLRVVLADEALADRLSISLPMRPNCPARGSG